MKIHGFAQGPKRDMRKFKLDATKTTKLNSTAQNKQLKLAKYTRT